MLPGVLVGMATDAYHCTFSPLYYNNTIRSEASQALAEMGANHYTLVGTRQAPP